MTYTVLNIEGIDPKQAEKLASAGIRTTDDLLKACRNQRGRKSVAAKSEIQESDLMKWTLGAELFRVRGVAGRFAVLLHAAGVHSLKDLKTGKADRISDAMHAHNETAKIAKVAPSIAVVKKWIDHSKTLKSVVTP